VIIASIGDSITAGSPLWDPDPAVRADEIPQPDERSQWQWWATQTRPQLEFRNHGVNGERTDQIAARLNEALNGAEALVVQGGINDVVQRRSIDDAASNLGAMVERAQQLGFRVALADVLPWNNGDDRAAHEIIRLNELVRAIADRLDVPLMSFHDTLVDPEQPYRMRADWTDDGDHPSVEGHRLLGERAFILP
jgi:lysophospholipase L1-like esterase